MKFQWFIGILLAVFFGFMANQEQISLRRGIKNFSGFIDFQDNPFKYGIGFVIVIQNKGLTTQDISFIKTDKKETIYLFHSHGNPAIFTVAPRTSKAFFLDPTPPLLKKLEKANSLILFNSNRDKKKIISKKDIQKVLKLYRKIKKYCSEC